MSPTNPYAAPRARVDAPPAREAATPTALAWLLSALLGGSILASLASAWASLVRLDVLARLYEEELDRALVLASDHLVVFAAILDRLLFLITAIIFAVWLVRASRVAWGRAPERMSISPGWAIAWFLIPLANLYRPYRAVREIWAASATTLEESRTPPVFPLWWGAWLLASVSGQLAALLGLRDIEVSLETAARVALLRDVTSVAAAGLALAVVTAIRRAQAAGREAHAPVRSDRSRTTRAGVASASPSDP